MTEISSLKTTAKSLEIHLFSVFNMPPEYNLYDKMGRLCWTLTLLRLEMPKRILIQTSK